MCVSQTYTIHSRENEYSLSFSLSLSSRQTSWLISFICVCMELPNIHICMWTNICLLCCYVGACVWYFLFACLFCYLNPHFKKNQLYIYQTDYLHTLATMLEIFLPLSSSSFSFFYHILSVCFFSMLSPHHTVCEKDFFFVGSNSREKKVAGAAAAASCHRKWMFKFGICY